MNRRTFKYIFLVTLFSSLFTITRFFEIETAYVYEREDIKNNYTVYIQPTELRLNTIYIKYYNWSRLIVLGIFPFVMLVYLNGLMYQDIKARRKKWNEEENNAEELTVSTGLQNNTIANNDMASNYSSYIKDFERSGRTSKETKAL